MFLLWFTAHFIQQLTTNNLKKNNICIFIYGIYIIYMRDALFW